MADARLGHRTPDGGLSGVDRLFAADATHDSRDGEADAGEHEARRFWNGRTNKLDRQKGRTVVRGIVANPPGTGRADSAAIGGARTWGHLETDIKARGHGNRGECQISVDERNGRQIDGRKLRERAAVDGDVHVDATGACSLAGTPSAISTNDVGSGTEATRMMRNGAGDVPMVRVGRDAFMACV